MPDKTSILLSIIAGIILASGFPPFDMYPAAWFAIVPLFMALRENKGKKAFFLGCLTGFVFFSATLYWIFHSVYYYSSISGVTSVLIVLLLSLFLSLYLGVFALLFIMISDRSRLPALFIAPVLWVTIEVIRSYLFTGFPWLLIGYSQYKFLPLIQAADITGIYGISFLVVAFNGALYDVAVSWPKRLKRMPLFGRWHLISGVVIYALLLTASLLYGLWQLGLPEGTKRIKASVIQGNIDQNRKWDASARDEIVDTYKEISLSAAEKSPDLIVWPEAALPFVFSEDSPASKQLQEFTKETGAYLITGGVTQKHDEYDNMVYANSSILISPEGEIASIYDKIHLVPFGEYVPLGSIFPFIRKLVVAVGDFRPGEEYTVMEMGSTKIASVICYEIIFPGLVRKFIDNGAEAIVTITNDAWFGNTPAPYQHFSMAVFRAVENRVPVIRAANTGVSGFIDTKGRIVSSSDIFVEAEMTEDLAIGSAGKTFYTKFGDLFAFLCIISSVLLAANRFFPEKRDQ